MKIGIVYYSRTGNTKKIAKTLEEKIKQKKAEVDLIEIEHEKRPGFFSASRVALKNKDLPIKNKDFNLDKYDLILTGTPTWAGRPSPYIKSYLKNVEKLKGKKAAVFVTCAGTTDKTEKVCNYLKEDFDNLGIKTIDNHLIIQMKKEEIIDGLQNIDGFVKNIMKS